MAIFMRLKTMCDQATVLAVLMTPTKKKDWYNVLNRLKGGKSRRENSNPMPIL